MSNNNKNPQGWDKKGKLPDNWGRSGNKLDNVTIPENSAKLPQKNNSAKPAEDKVHASDKARVGAGKLADIAKRAGEAAKNAAGSAVEYARSDEAKEKMNAAKSKAQSLVSGAGSALSELKDKTSETIGNIRSDAASKEEQISEVFVEESENATVQDDGDKQEMTEVVSVYENHDEIAVDSIETGMSEAVIREKSEINEDQTEGFAAEFDNAPVQDDADEQELTETVSAYNDHGETEEKRAYPKSPAFANNRSARPAAPFRTPSPPIQEKTAASPAHEEKKSSPIIFVLIAVIAVLLVGSCVIGSVIFMISKKNTKENSSSTSVSSEVTDIAEATEESGNTSESITTSTYTAKIDSTTTSQEKTTTAVETDQYQVYKDKILASVNNEEYAGNDSHIENAPADMVFYDIDSTLTQIEKNNISLYIGPAETFEKIDSGGYSNFYVVGENSDWYYLMYYTGTGRFTHPTYGYASKKASASNAPKPTASIQVEPQYVFGNGTLLLLTVNGNYSYYTYEIYADCEVGNHVLRSSGTSYEKSYLYEDGSTVSNFVFYVTPYSDNGVAGETVSMNYNGPNMLYRSEITPCQLYGQINVPSGGPINGYTTDYIVNDGAYSCVRTDLMNNWHVTAVNSININGTRWYELYDTDDGDYYGWLDEDHIKFY